MDQIDLNMEIPCSALYHTCYIYMSVDAYFPSIILNAPVIKVIKHKY